MRRSHWRALVVVVALIVFPVASFGIFVGQIDDFEDGTVQGWGGEPPSNVTTGGPGGSGDNYLQVSSGAFGIVPRLVTHNRTQWVGDYAAQGVVQIEMDLRNFGSSALPIRVAIREGTGGSATPGYVSTTPFNLPADAQWHHAVFSLEASALTPINSPNPLAQDLTAVAELRILSSASPALLGDAIDAQIGIDNITAAIPEPALAGALMVIVIACAPRRTRRPKTPVQVGND